MTILAAVGAGNWGSNWVRTLAGMGTIELRWVCDLRPAALARVRRQYPNIRTTTYIEDLLDDPEVDGVVIASSARTHFDLARETLLAGKHVLVEKPMTLATADARDLDRLAKEQGRVLMVGHLLEYHPAFVFIRELIAAGELGEVQHIYSQRLNLGTVRTDENAWWSLAPHDIGVACRLLGMPRSVQCRGQSMLQPDVVDVAFGQLEFPGGKLAQIHVSWLDPHKTRKITVIGSKGMVDFDDTVGSNKVIVYDKGVRPRRGRDGRVERFANRTGDIVIPKLEPGEPLLREARHFVECIEQGQRPLSDGEAGTLVVSLLEAGQRSMDQGGAAVRLPEDRRNTEVVGVRSRSAKIRQVRQAWGTSGPLDR
jgi:predicted dehydrogenase